MLLNNIVMDWARSWVGVTKPVAAPAVQKPHAIVERHQAASATMTHEEQLAKLERAQEVQLMLLQRKLHTAEQDCKRATGPALKTALLRKHEIGVQIAKHSATMSNTRAMKSVTETASSNVEQALIMKQSAAAIGGLNTVMEEIDVATVASELQQNAHMVSDFTEIVSRPLNLDPTVDMDDVDAEIEAEMAMREEAAALAAMDVRVVVAPVVAPATTHTAAPVLKTEPLETEN